MIEEIAEALTEMADAYDSDISRAEHIAMLLWASGFMIVPLEPEPTLQ